LFFDYFLALVVALRLLVDEVPRLRLTIELDQQVSPLDRVPRGISLVMVSALNCCPAIRGAWMDRAVTAAVMPFNRRVWGAPPLVARDGELEAPRRPPAFPRRNSTPQMAATANKAANAAIRRAATPRGRRASPDRASGSVAASASSPRGKPSVLLTCGQLQHEIVSRQFSSVICVYANILHHTSGTTNRNTAGCDGDARVEAIVSL
jgi:hypothetical protein